MEFAPVGAAGTSAEPAVAGSGGASSASENSAGKVPSIAAGSGGSASDAGGGGDGGTTVSPAGSTNGGDGGTAGGTSTAGNGGSADVACAGVAAWSERAYVMGERATAICKSPYSGLCEAGVLHEFECRPEAGVVGLGWCHDREPGVINGWQEAWLLRARCAQ